jgi:hypothetical protein
MVRDHLAELPVQEQLHRFPTEPGRQRSIERGWRSAALQVTQDDVARLFAGALFELLCAKRACSPKPLCMSALRRLDE